MDLYELQVSMEDGIYSELQLVRHFETLKQLRKIWSKTYDILKFCRNSGMDIEELNNIIIKGLFKIFFTEYRDYIEYYTEENIESRKIMCYKRIKINRLKNSIYEL
jgi:hypothetical protein